MTPNFTLLRVLVSGTVTPNLTPETLSALADDMLDGMDPTDQQETDRDTIDAHADAWAAREARLAALEQLLADIRKWDMLDAAADGEYWKGLIDERLAEVRKGGDDA